ncbi:class I SAM-dependent methyltransferase [Cellvibrio sp.]|uniref:class I SAM-dependent methyltransferase n=1 Tax=Cellvibrio sp. TaxID=1965322 RepID=UPI003964850B
MITRQDCPLCQNKHVDLIESIGAEDISYEYMRQFNIYVNIQCQIINLHQCQSCKLKFYSPYSTGDEELYKSLQRFDWYYLENKNEFLIANQHIPETGNVLEVGAGRAAFADICGKKRYTGLEFNDAAIAKATLNNINLIKEPIESFATKNKEKFSAVVAFQVLEHIGDIRSFIEGCILATKPSGIIIFAVPNNEGICGLAQNSILDMPPHHNTLWSESTLLHLSTIYGLETVAIHKEPVAEIHKVWAEKSIILNRLFSLFGVTKLLLDNSIKGRIFRSTSKYLARFLPPPIEQIAGHTILACYRKPDK